MFLLGGGYILTLYGPADSIAFMYFRTLVQANQVYIYTSCYVWIKFTELCVSREQTSALGLEKTSPERPQWTGTMGRKLTVLGTSRGRLVPTGVCHIGNRDKRVPTCP